MSAVAVHRVPPQHSTEASRKTENPRPYFLIVNKDPDRRVPVPEDLSNGDPPSLMLWGEE